MIMDKNEKLPSTHSLLDKLTIRIASGMDDEYKRKLSMQQPLSIENKFNREPTLDIDKELIELESLIKNLQTEIVEMTKNANTPQSEYIPNNDIAETKVNQNIFDSLPPISVNDVEATFKSLWNSSNSDTTKQSDIPDVSDDLKNELRKEIFGDADFMNSLNNIEQSIEPKPFDKVTDKDILSEEAIDNSKNHNIKTGLIMRIFGSNDNTSKADNLNPSVSQRIFDIFSTNKSQTPILDNKTEPEAIHTDSLLATDDDIHKVEHNLLLDSTDGVKKSFVNNSVPKSQPNIASENKPNPPKDSTSEDPKKSSSIKNLLLKIEQSLVNTFIGTNKKSSDVPLIKNNTDDKTDSRLEKKESVTNTHKDSDSKTKIAHKLNVINIYIDTPKSDFELRPTQNKTSVTKNHQGEKGKTSISMASKNVSITQLKQTSGTDSVNNDNSLQNTVHSCQKNKETTDITKKGNSKSTSLLNTNNLNSHRNSSTKLTDIDNSSTEFIKTGIYQPNKRTMSDTSVLKPLDRFDMPFESMKNKPSKDFEIQANKNVITKKISNTRISADINDPGHDVHDCHIYAVDDSFDDCLDDAPDHITNNINNSQIEKPVIVVQFSEQPNVLEKEIVITKPISSGSNIFKVYTRSKEDLGKDKIDVYRSITGDVEPASKIVDIKSLDEKHTDKEVSIIDDKTQSVLKDSQPIYINSTLITINNIDSNDDEFEDSQDFIQEPAAMETPKKQKKE